MKSLQEAVEEFEKTERTLTKDTEEALEGLHQHLMFNEYSLNDEDIGYMICRIHGLKRDPANPENSYFAQVVVRNKILSCVHFSARNQFLSLLEDCAREEISPDEIEETATDFVAKHGDTVATIQIPVMKYFAQNILEELKHVCNAKGDANHYINNSVARVINDYFIHILTEIAKRKEADEFDKAA